MYLRPALVATLSVLLVAPCAAAQQPYARPPADVVAIVDAPPTPTVRLSPDREWMALLERRAHPAIEQLAQPALGLAGVRFNPQTNGDDQPPLGTAIQLVRVRDGRAWKLTLPAGVQLTTPLWAHDSKHVAFTNTTDAGVELWIASRDSRQARRLTGPELQAAGTGSRSGPRPCEWTPDSAALVCQLVPADRGAPPERPLAPSGPTIQEAAGGQRATVRTYQNLLSSPFDERLFDYYFTAQLARIDLQGERTPIGEPAIFAEVDLAPDGRHVLVRTVQRPYSYLVPLSRFPQQVEVWGHDGAMRHAIASLPLAEEVPIGGVAEGPRSIGWLPGQGHTLVWSEALDGGDPKAEAEHRDRLVTLEPPFRGDPVELTRTELRHSRTRWSADGRLALLRTFDRRARTTKTVVVDAAAPGAVHPAIWSRSSEDVYSDPGDPMMTRTAQGQSVLLRSPDGSSIYLAGDGASPTGAHPFLDRYELATGKVERLWQSADPHYDSLVAILDPDLRQVLIRRESKTQRPNYFVLERANGEMRPLTDLKDPAPQLTNVSKRRIEYTRADGVALNGTLYLPPGYQQGTRLPTVVWAYPREYKSASAAGQVRGSVNRFTFYRGYSHLFFLTQGYAVLAGASMPVVGEADEEPNDSFVEQLVMNAQAAVDALVALGVTDPDRVGVGGHSYGAFMTANLLAHSDIFRAGIARSGAYNRTLTPFGFQNEERTFWEAPEVYFAMSPFMHAGSIDEPILLLHGEADNNSGTFPVQSRRLYHAVKGLRGTIKLVTYPHEQHGYRALETVLDALYQQFAWFDRYVKNAPPRGAATATQESETSGRR